MQVSVRQWAILCFVPLFVYCSMPVENNDQKPEVNSEIQPGSHQTDQYFERLQGNKIGLVTNQTGTIGKVLLVDTLIEAGIEVAKIFSPEHGFRGNEDAGKHVESSVDKKTGIPLVSLYGKNKKPSVEMLEGIDIMVFDIQDVGARFYTYISTLHYVMEACAENSIPLIILDRPNPNGHYVDGPVLDMEFNSFVGMHPVPIVYGMTIGEYGQMINGESWLKNGVQCELTVVPCKNYNHQSKYSLPIPPSPNLKSDLAIAYYPSLCLFEPTVISVGRGTNRPFEVFGHPSFKDKLEYSFTPVSTVGASAPKLEFQTCYGIDMAKLGTNRLRRLRLDIFVNAYKQYGTGDSFFTSKSFFNKLI